MELATVVLYSNIHKSKASLFPGMLIFYGIECYFGLVFEEEY